MRNSADDGAWGSASASEAPPRTGGGPMNGFVAGMLRSIGGLVRAEINLATSEMTGKASRIGKDVGLLGAGGALAFAGFLAILAAKIRLLETFLPRWLAALVVGLATVGAGAAVAGKGFRALKQTDLAPEQTIESLKSLAE